MLTATIGISNHLILWNEKIDLESVMVDNIIFFIFGGKLIPQQSAATLKKHEPMPWNGNLCLLFVDVCVWSASVVLHLLSYRTDLSSVCTPQSCLGRLDIISSWSFLRTACRLALGALSHAILSPPLNIHYPLTRA
jgi:hypothetical protein